MLSMKLKNTLKLALVCTLLSVFLVFTACSGGSNQPLKIDSPAPNFTLKDLNGKSVTLSSFIGKTVFLHFWDTTFASCIAEMPYFQELYTGWTSSGEVALLTINAEETGEVIKTFMQSQKYTFPVLLDTEYKVAGKYNVQYVPTSFLIDKQGKLRLNIIGPFKTKADIEKQLAGLIP